MQKMSKALYSNYSESGKGEGYINKNLQHRVQSAECSNRSKSPCLEEMASRTDFLEDIMTDIKEDTLIV